MKARKLTIALAALALAGAPLANARDTGAADKLGWKLGVQCWTFRALTFYETVDKVHELGIGVLEMYPGQRLKPDSESKTGAEMSDADIEAMKAKLKEAGVELYSFGVAPVPTDEAAARKHFDWARKMGLKVLVTETKPTPRLDRLSEEYGIRIALHNHPQSWPPEQVLEACQGLSDRIGSCSDTGHWKRRGLVPVEQLRTLQGRVIELHFKDVAKNGGGKSYEDQPWGTGECDAKAILAELKKQGFKGCFIAEYEVGTVADLMKNLPRCVEFFDSSCSELAK
jgi:sugar phosphate isomerase/epimerase